MIFVELNMKGRQHLIANSGFVDIYSNAGEENYLVADRLHAREVMGLKSETRVLSCIPFPVIRSGGALAAISKTCLEVFGILLVFLFAKIKRQDLFFLSSYASAKPFIEFFNGVFRVKVYVVHHGDLVGLRSESRGRFARYVKAYFRNRHSEKITDVFLSQRIHDNAIRLIGRTLPSSFVALHPFPKKGAAACRRTAQQKGRRLCIGYFGALTEENRGRLQQILDALSSRSVQDFDLALIAPKAHLFNLGNLHCKEIVDTTIPLSNNEFAEHIAKLDVAIFPYTAGQYDLIASGVIVDCLIYGIKFICVRSDYFNDWLDAYPSAGELFDSFDEMVVTLANPAYQF